MRKLVERLVLLGVGTLIAVLLAEGVLRVVPFRLNDYHSTVAFAGDSDLGYRPVPNQDATNNLSCVRNPHVKTNTLGLRGPEWAEAPASGIALLGDSFLFAVTISEPYHLATRLGAVSGRPVWNAGVSGYGTYQELLIWRKWLRQRRPAVTVLFLYLENDIRDNQCDLARAENQKYSPCLAVRDGRVIERTEFENPTAGSRLERLAQDELPGLSGRKKPPAAGAETTARLLRPGKLRLQHLSPRLEPQMGGGTAGARLDTPGVETRNERRRQSAAGRQCSRGHSALTRLASRNGLADRQQGGARRLRHRLSDPPLARADGCGPD